MSNNKNRKSRNKRANKQPVKVNNNRRQNSGPGRKRYAPRTSSFNSRTRTLSVTFNHSEFVQNVVVSAEGDIQLLHVNPGLLNSFPWLSTWAPSFERYEFKSLEYMYTPMVGSDTTGRVNIIPVYDAADAGAALGWSKNQLLECSDAAGGSVWGKIRMRPTPRNLRSSGKYHMVRSSGTPDQLKSELNEYDPLALILYLTDAPVGKIGELWVKYTIEMITPAPGISPFGIRCLAEAETPIWDTGLAPFLPAYEGSTIGTITTEDIDQQHVAVPEIGTYIFDVTAMTDLTANIADLHIPSCDHGTIQWDPSHILSSGYLWASEFILSTITSGAVLEFLGLVVSPTTTPIKWHIDLIKAVAQVVTGHIDTKTLSLRTNPSSRKFAKFGKNNIVVSPTDEMWKKRYPHPVYYPIKGGHTHDLSKYLATLKRKYRLTSCGRFPIFLPEKVEGPKSETKKL